MKIIAIDTEYDYTLPFLATSTNEQMETTVYRPSEKAEYDKLKDLCEDHTILKIFHNITADKSRLKNIGIDVCRPYGDTMIASSLVNENYAPRALKKLVRDHLGEETKESNRLKSVITKYKKKAKDEGRIFRWSDIPDEYIIPYAKRDPEYTLQLWYYFQKPLARVQALYKFELSLVPIIVKMNQKGMRINRAFAKEKIPIYRKEKYRLYKALNAYVKTHAKGMTSNVNPGSPLQIAKALAKLKIETNKVTKTGLPATDADSLIGVNHPFVKLLREWRFYNKHLGTYYEPLYEYYTSDKNDVAHFDMYQVGAKTGRFSAELIQTFPRPGEDVARGKKHEVRRLVIPRKNKWLVCIDYRQIEMWLFIHYTNCTRLIEKAGREIDVYLETANILFDDLMLRDDLRKPLRRVSKTIALGLIFGMGMRKLLLSVVHEMMESVNAKIIKELGISRTWGSQVIDRFYQLYPVRQFSHELISEVYRVGYVELKFDSPLMNFHRYYNIPQELAYKAPNTKIQGTAAYVIKHAMKRIDTRIKREGWDHGGVDMLMQVHDELIFEVDKDLPLRSTVDILMEEMEDKQTFKVPILAEPKVSDVSWADVKEMEVLDAEPTRRRRKVIQIN